MNDDFDISDRELFKQLQELGYNPPPVTRTTKVVLRKKLLQLLNGKKLNTSTNKRELDYLDKENESNCSSNESEPDYSNNIDAGIESKSVKSRYTSFYSYSPSSSKNDSKPTMDVTELSKKYGRVQQFSLTYWLFIISIPCLCYFMYCFFTSGTQSFEILPFGHPRSRGNNAYQFSSVIGILIFVMLVVLILCYTIYRRNKLSGTSEMHKLVNDVVQMLQNGVINGYKCVPINDVRDALIPQHERVCKQQLWEDVVSYISENDSRIRKEVINQNNKVVYVWRWLLDD